MYVQKYLLLDKDNVTGAILMRSAEELELKGSRLIRFDIGSVLLEILDGLENRFSMTMNSSIESQQLSTYLVKSFWLRLEN